MKTCALALLLCAAVAGCASKPKLDTTIDEAPTPEFQRGVKMLEREDYGAAADTFDRLLVNKPATENDLVISYNSGAAHEGLGQCAKAGERYREIVRSSAGKFKRLEAQAFYRLSLMYECLGQDTKTVTALLDTKKRAKQLPLELARAELPARLAAAYSRLGNREKAIEYFGQASEGLKILLAEGLNTKKQKDTLGRTLYFMGRLNPSQRDANGDGNAYLQSLSMQQPYLLQAVEVAPAPWSKKAYEDLTLAYDNIFRFNVKSAEQRHQYWVRSLQVIAELRKIRMPDGGPEEDSIFGQVDKTERQVQNRLADGAETLPLTPEAQRRDGVIRGRLVDPQAPATAPVKKTKK